MNGSNSAKKLFHSDVFILVVFLILAGAELCFVLTQVLELHSNAVLSRILSLSALAVFISMFLASVKVISYLRNNLEQIYGYKK